MGTERFLRSLEMGDLCARAGPVYGGPKSNERIDTNKARLQC